MWMEVERYPPVVYRRAPLLYKDTFCSRLQGLAACSAYATIIMQGSWQATCPAGLADDATGDRDCMLFTAYRRACHDGMWQRHKASNCAGGLGFSLLFIFLHWIVSFSPTTCGHFSHVAKLRRALGNCSCIQPDHADGLTLMPKSGVVLMPGLDFLYSTLYSYLTQPVQAFLAWLICQICTCSPCAASAMGFCRIQPAGFPPWHAQ